MELAPELTGVSPTEMRSTLARFATGVVVLTVGGERMHGMTANAFSSVSLDPPLVLCCVARTAVMHDAITSAGHFAASMLRGDQETSARWFAARDRPLGSAQFDEVDWVSGPATGAPVLAGSLAWLECELADVHEAGDHSVFFGRVLGAGRGDGRAGLLFFDGAYWQVDTSERRR
ncbi:flavin reductase family protein [Saccharothrix longispora]|uniref:flavin reductase family protein n=1 Tax=Saccharothrix longispora TaxID=33920 RepID=UPI0028FD79F8|nr:flavin reductase family protein [Saccharothrix longispora]MBY8849606.1 flavin reductase family protein [Saccharothrix sp. MB29]MDU0287695.1 flavin reductase family protein [Saccharothrix longispora]